MIDLKILRDTPEIVRKSQKNRGENPELVDQVLAADTKRRESIQKFDELRFTQKQLSKQVGEASPAERPQLLQQAKDLAKQVKELEANTNVLEEEFNRLYSKLGNIVLPEVPAGGEENFRTLEEVGVKPDLASPLDHLELGEKLKLIDMERGAKVSGARFYFLTGMGAMLHLGLLNLAAKTAVENGFQLMIPPVLVNPNIMAGTGFLGAHEEEIYYLPKDEMYLVGTSEVALAGYHSGEIIDLSKGPIRYAGWSTCFRREAGSYGKDTRGIIRVHQFDKVEMFSYCPPEMAETEHEKLLNLEKQLLTDMGLPFRVIDVAAGDLGSSAARKYDCEAWLPSQNRYLELTSTSNCTTFQARRLGVRYRDKQGKVSVAATLNGTLATMRWLVAILENNQQPDGSVKVPEKLIPFVGTDILKPS